MSVKPATAKFKKLEVNMETLEINTPQSCIIQYIKMTEKVSLRYISVFKQTLISQVLEELTSIHVGPNKIPCPSTKYLHNLHANPLGDSTRACVSIIYPVKGHYHLLSVKYMLAVRNLFYLLAILVGFC